MALATSCGFLGLDGLKNENDMPFFFPPSLSEGWLFVLESLEILSNR